jgi:endonuclease-3 related protein
VLLDVFRRLHKAYGPQEWWPADSPVEVVVGAILTQNTAWSNVRKAIRDLAEADCLGWAALRDVPVPELERLIRPSGTFRVKAARLKSFVAALWHDHGGDLGRLLSGPVAVARQRLLRVPGVGPETADAILLYAGNRRSFVVDAYTRRILRRHFILSNDDDYEATRALFQQHLPHSARLYNEYHALLVAVGKRHCRGTAVCNGCPLSDLAHDERE